MKNYTALICILICFSTSIINLTIFDPRFAFGIEQEKQDRYEEETAQERDDFMQGLRNLPQKEKDRILKLMDECEFAPNASDALKIHDLIDKAWKQNRLRRHGDFTTIRFVLKEEKETFFPENEAFITRELNLGLQENVYGSSKCFLAKKAHRQKFEEFVFGLRNLNKADRDTILDLQDKADFDANDAGERIKIYDKIIDILKKNKIRRASGIKTTCYILQKMRDKEAESVVIHITNMVLKYFRKN